jgi:hypothetical protein
MADPNFADPMGAIPSDQYEADIVIWADRQAALLRRVAAGESPNETPDWENIIDEVESLGRSETRACASLLTQMLLHQMKIAAWPNSTAVPGWTEEVARLRWEAADAFAPSMRKRLDVTRIYAQALRELHRMPQTIDGQLPLPVATVCPVTLDELLTRALGDLFTAP